MAETAGAKAEALDATVSTQDGMAAERPPTRDELDYLDARVEETTAAVKKIKAMIKGLQQTLKAAEQAAADAKASQKAGRDLPEVQRRRAA
jgi:prefoldin subunit 5